MTTRPFGRGNLYHLLSNPIYAGKVRHRDQLHNGEHEAIISEDLFREVQSLLGSQARGEGIRKTSKARSF